MTRSWTIGAHPDCDLVVNLLKVSGRHCRLTRDDSGYILEDLGSTNGTYVNGQRVLGAIRVAPGDSVTLGLTAPMPWPDASEPARVDPSSLPKLPFRGREAVIGRGSDCDLVIDNPKVSSRHARLLPLGHQIWIEDLGSANGTYVNAQLVEGKAVVREGDLIALGSHVLAFTVESAVILEESPPAVIEEEPPATLIGIEDKPPPPLPLPPPLPPIHLAPALQPAPALYLAPPLPEPPKPWARWALLLGQAPLLAVLIVGVLKGKAPSMTSPEDWAVLTRSVAAVLYWLGLAVVWFGLSDAVLGDLVDPSRFREWLTSRGARPLGSRFLVLGLLGLGQCVLAWALVSILSGLKGPGFPMLIMLILGWAVGLGLGWLLMAVTPRSVPVWTMLAPVMVVVGLLGGGLWPVGSMPAGVRSVANVVPSRWAFEGLLLLEAERYSSSNDRDGVETGRNHDLAEAAFPAASDRMGVRADAMALGLMAIGLTAAAGFIAVERGRQRGQGRKW